VIACAPQVRGADGSQVMNGSFDPRAHLTTPWPLAAPYAFRSLNTLSRPPSSEARIRLVAGAGPTHDPGDPVFGAGPGGFGIFGILRDEAFLHAGAPP